MLADVNGVVASGRWIRKTRRRPADPDVDVQHCFVCGRIDLCIAVAIAWNASALLVSALQLVKSL